MGLAEHGGTAMYKTKHPEWYDYERMKWHVYERRKAQLRERERHGEQFNWDQEIAKIIQQLKL
jgi:hypothetical protein